MRKKDKEIFILKNYWSDALGNNQEKEEFSSYSCEEVVKKWFWWCGMGHCADILAWNDNVGPGMFFGILSSYVDYHQHLGKKYFPRKITYKCFNEKLKEINMFDKLTLAQRVLVFYHLADVVTNDRDLFDKYLNEGYDKKILYRAYGGTLITTLENEKEFIKDLESI